MVLLDSILPKDSNGMSFVNFGLINWKIWILQDWIEIWSEFLIWVSSKPEADTWHDLVGGYRFRVDRRSGALDLSGPGRTWFFRTPSLKWFNLNHKIQIGWSWTEERGAHRIWLGFVSPAASSGSGRGHHRCFEGSWTMEAARQGLRWGGEGDRLGEDLGCFQKMEGEVAGAAMGGGGLRPLMFSSISCRMDEGDKSGRGAWARWRS
jgi:hypothetical protein